MSRPTAAVQGDCLGRLFVNPKGLHLRRRHQVHRFFVNVFVIARRWPAARIDEFVFDRVEHVPPAVEAFVSQVFTEGSIGQNSAAVDLVRGVFHADEAGAFAGAADRDERGDFELLALQAQFQTHDRPERGMHDGRVGSVAGVQVIAPAGMIGLAGAHRAHDRQMFHRFGGLRQVLGDLQVAGRADGLEFAGVLGAGLEVPHIDRRRTAAHPQQDAGLLLFANLFRVRFDMREKVEPRHRQTAHRQMLDEVPARESGTGNFGRGEMRCGELRERALAGLYVVFDGTGQCSDQIRCR